MQVRRRRRVRGRAGADQQIDRRKMRKQLAPGMLAQAAPQPIARDGGVTEAGRDHPQPRMAVTVGAPDDLEPRGAPARAGTEDRLDLGREPQAPAPREALGRQAAPCLEGSLTVSRRRPFLRRRLSTSRPQRVFMRARKPCLRMRRLFRG